MALRDTLDRFVEFDLMGAPVGAGAAFAVADAVAQAVVELIDKYIKLPPIVTGIGLSVVDRRYLRSERWLGDRLSSLINLALCKRAVDSQFNLTEKVSSFISRISGKTATAGVGEITSGPSFGEIGEIASSSTGSSLGEVPSVGKIAPVGLVGVKASDILQLRKKRLEAYS